LTPSGWLALVENNNKNYCDSCRSAVTVIMSSDAAVKTFVERLAVSYISQTKEIL